jgi:xanthine dehydrogenase YagS FAD-binding subunit
VSEAVSAAAQPDTTVIAGGTEVLNWLKEGIITPARLLDISRLPELDRIDADASGLRIGALARMSDVAAHATVRQQYPAISEALLASASPQLRHMASMAGNLLQRTRCPYFRAETELPCNKRHPQTGCSALQGEDRNLAIFGWSEHCLATHPSDVAVALAALDAKLHVQSAAGTRQIPLVDFHRLPENAPERDNVLTPGELVLVIEVPASAVARRSYYLKLRERASYEFALVSAAAAVELENRVIKSARLALGGVASKPWRLTLAEQALRGLSIKDTAGLRRALAADFALAKPGKHNGFKVEWAQRAALRALQTAGEIA